MAYTNSSLVTYTNLTKNRSNGRNNTIDTITIHCYVGQVTAKEGCDYFATTDRECSSNYVVGRDGGIGLSVEEKNRAWTSGGKDANGKPIRVNGISGADNDHRAVTIEVACDTTHPHAVTNAAYNSLINLVADICKRNGIKKLLWKDDKSLVGKVDKQNMTLHQWFAYTACPGTYLYERYGDIAAKVNAKLGVVEEVSTAKKVKVGNVVTFTGTSHYVNTNSTLPVGCRPGKATVTHIHENGKHPYHLVRVEGGTSNVYGWVNSNDIWELTNTVDDDFKVGDIVIYNDTVHYVNANAEKFLTCKNGKARITQIYQIGRSKHPYHLVGISGGSTVYGWVDEGSFDKV